MPLSLGFFLFLAACKKSNTSSSPTPLDPSTAPAASIDRFSTAAGHLQVRTATNGLPAANAPVNFDQAPFITTGFAPDGSVVQYYNFDIQPTAPAPIYVLTKQGQTTSIPGQNIIDVIPGSNGYNDFWQIYNVTVPANYVANTITSYAGLMASGYPISMTSNLVNCPVVPAGSVATQRYPSSGSAALTQGWYKDSVVYYFNFSEKALTTNSAGQVPVIPIYVTFNINPNQPNGGPSSGIETEPGSAQTHNVISALPTDPGYSPLWAVAVYNDSSFNSVNNWTTAMAAPVLVPDAGNVNCPVVSHQ